MATATPGPGPGRPAGDGGCAASSATTCARSTSSRSLFASPLSLRASTSSPSMSRSLRRLLSSSVCRVRTRSSGDGSSSPIWMAARWVASGVRSSCEALAMNRRWLSNAFSSRASSASSVSPSSFSSSSGPPAAIRSCRVCSDSSRAFAVMAWTGRSTRPAVHQPTATAQPVMTSRAATDQYSSSRLAASLTSSVTS